MKNIILKIAILLVLFQTKVFAATGDVGIFSGISGDDNKKLENVRNGDIHVGDIPAIIKGAIDILMGVAGTIAVIFIIVGAYKIMFGALAGDKSKGKDDIVMALTGFALASLAWFIIKFIIDNLA